MLKAPKIKWLQLENYTLNYLVSLNYIFLQLKFPIPIKFLSIEGRISTELFKALTESWQAFAS